MSDTGKATGSSTGNDTTSEGFSRAEKAAMKERARELKAEARASKTRADGERDVLASIAAMPQPDRVIAKRLHALISAAAPGLMPKTWYGMPAYARDGKVVCYFKAAAKFGARYAQLGFEDAATLDEGDMWPTVFALKSLADDEAARITELVKRATS